MTVRVRRNVYELPAGDETLDWYRQAVAHLWTLPVTNPTSWRYMGAVHGNPGFPPGPGTAGFWDRCQHQTWFFLPWHRGYLAAFESIIAKTVVDLGGPAEWALPYWDYTVALTTNPDARTLPPAFRDQTLPNGDPNPLFAPRAVPASGQVPLSDLDVSLDALNDPDFTPPSGFGAGFGGPPTGFSHGGMQNGRLERVPHNAVHVRIGGWMGDPNTAAFDPIFWLHHCNIDRLWEEWRVADPAHTNPTAPAWATALSFNMHDADGNAFTFTSSDMEDTTQVMHGYRYDNVAPPTVVVAGAVPETMISMGVPELAGASESAVDLAGTRTEALVALQPEATSKSFIESTLPTPGRVYLRLEGVTGTGAPGDYTVYLDLPGDSEPPVSIGLLTTFGIATASDVSAAHGGGGLTQDYDITELAERLGLTTESAPQIRVSFERIEQGAVTESMMLPGLEETLTPTAGEGSVRVGRIGIYYD